MARSLSILHFCVAFSTTKIDKNWVIGAVVTCRDALTSDGLVHEAPRHIRESNAVRGKRFDLWFFFAAGHYLKAKFKL